MHHVGARARGSRARARRRRAVRRPVIEHGLPVERPCFSMVMARDYDSIARRSTLPPLSAEERAHSRGGARADPRARSLRRAAGFRSMHSWSLALYAPGLGYYSAGSVKLGAGGDFVTAPELSDLFSNCVARQCAEILAETGGSILELGAGSGPHGGGRARDAGRRWTRCPQRYAILEVSADLRARQQAADRAIARRAARAGALARSPARAALRRRRARRTRCSMHCRASDSSFAARMSARSA